MSEPDVGAEACRALEALGAARVRAAIAGRGDLGGIDIAVARTWLLARDMRAVKRFVWYMRFHNALLLLAALASMVLIIAELLNWLD